MSVGIWLVDMDGSPPLPCAKDALAVTSVQHGWLIVNVLAVAEKLATRHRDSVHAPLPPG